ncbi:MAG TPA: hypothetical protein VH083_11775, partial [Myxococcales bacterium]|nr:hypothetical protein [Myxococcales bacterium]
SRAALPHLSRFQDRAKAIETARMLKQPDERARRIEIICLEKEQALGGLERLRRVKKLSHLVVERLPRSSAADDAERLSEVCQLQRTRSPQEWTVPRSFSWA